MNKTVARAIRILETLAYTSNPMTMTDLRRELDLPKSTASEIINTLIELKILTYDTKDKIFLRPGIKFFEMASAFVNKNGLLAVASTCMSALADKTGETVMLFAVDGGMMVSLAKMIRPGTLQTEFFFGERIPMHASASGKAVLATRNLRDLQKMLGPAPFERFTGNTLTHYDDLLPDLTHSRERRYSLDNRERNDFLVAVAAPIRPANNQSIAAISLAGLYNRVPQKRLTEFGPIVYATAMEISRMLGFTGKDLFQSQ